MARRAPRPRLARRADPAPGHEPCRAFLAPLCSAGHRQPPRQPAHERALPARGSPWALVGWEGSLELGGSQDTRWAGDGAHGADCWGVRDQWVRPSLAGHCRGRSRPAPAAAVRGGVRAGQPLPGPAAGVEGFGGCVRGCGLAGDRGDGARDPHQLAHAFPVRLPQARDGQGEGRCACTGRVAGWGWRRWSHETTLAPVCCAEPAASGGPVRGSAVRLHLPIRAGSGRRPKPVTDVAGPREAGGGER